MNTTDTPVDTTLAHSASVAPSKIGPKERKVIFASSVGAIFEFYEFYLYGSLAVFLAAKFFAPGDPTVAFLASLAAMASGFLVRPFGALVFGAIGDRIGRKYTFLMTLVLMAVTTAGIGLLPTFEQIGHAAWIILLILRLLQGLAIGGEYGGAAVYVAEHAPAGRRGFMTSWIQTTGTLGIICAVVVVLGVQASMSVEAFQDWGWRLPFLFSIPLLLPALWIRRSLSESPVFQKMKAEGRTSKTPLRDSFGRWKNLKFVLLALFAVTMAGGALGNTSQVYVMFFLQQVLKLDLGDVYLVLCVSQLMAVPMFIFAGWLSDKIGRKPVILGGFILALLLYKPLFAAMVAVGNPALVEARQLSPVVLHTQDGPACSYGLSASLISSHPDNSKECVKAKKLLLQTGVDFSFGEALPGQTIGMSVNGKQLVGFDAAAYNELLWASGYPQHPDKNLVNRPLLILILFALASIMALVYGTMGAFLVELFPARIRYTSLSLPYHIGLGCIGGFVPFLAAFFSVSTGSIYAGLNYPLAIVAVSLVCAVLFLRETRDRITEE